MDEIYAVLSVLTMINKFNSCLCHGSAGVLQTPGTKICYAWSYVVSIINRRNFRQKIVGILYGILR